MDFEKAIRGHADGPVVRPPLDDILAAGDRHNRRRRGLVATGAVVGLLALVGVGLALSGGDQDGSGFATDPETEADVSTPSTSIPASTTTPTSARYEGPSPLLLLDLPGWQVVRVQEDHDRGTGEMTFRSEVGEADLHWRDGDFEGWAEDRASSAAVVVDRVVLGADAQVSQYEGTGTDFTALWVEDGRVLEFRGYAEDMRGFDALLDALVRVRANEWLAALPADAVTPIDEADVLAAMVADIPRPPGFDLAEVASEGAVTNRYDLGARLTGAVACAWIGQWIDATSTGDQAGAQEAMDALATARNWPILVELDPQGGWSDVVWQMADAVAGDGTMASDTGTGSIADTYRAALGCG